MKYAHSLRHNKTIKMNKKVCSYILWQKLAELAISIFWTVLLLLAYNVWLSVWQVKLGRIGLGKIFIFFGVILNASQSSNTALTTIAICIVILKHVDINNGRQAPANINNGTPSPDVFGCVSLYGCALYNMVFYYFEFQYTTVGWV